MNKWGQSYIQVSAPIANYSPHPACHVRTPWQLKSTNHRKAQGKNAAQDVTNSYPVVCLVSSLHLSLILMGATTKPHENELEVSDHVPSAEILTIQEIYAFKKNIHNSKLN